MDLQQAIEKFLADTERRRSEVTARRYGEAMELLQSYLALELIDPEVPESGAGTVADITPQAIGKFVDDFLINRLGSNERAQRRYVAALRSFIQWLVKADLMSASVGEETLGALRRISRPQTAGTAAAEDALAGRFFQVLSVTPNGLQLLDLDSGREVRSEEATEFALSAGDIVAGELVRQDGRAVATNLRIFDAGTALDDDEAFEGFDEGDEPELWSSPNAEPLLEDALEILAAEDRYAPREVVRVILDNFDEARDDLIEWLTDDEYRNEPFPAAGEAPANAARLLSEMRDPDAFDRLMSALGSNDPLGEEAPLALARYGPRALPQLAEALHQTGGAAGRRTAALWAMAFVAVRNPAVRTEVVQQLAEALGDKRREVRSEALTALEEMRAVESLPRVAELAESGALDLEAMTRTLDLFESRLKEEGWGERFNEAFFPVLYLYPTNEELEEFYESLEEDLGEFWSLMGVEDDEDIIDDPDDDDGDGGDDGGGGEERGKVIPFKRPR